MRAVSKRAYLAKMKWFRTDEKLPGNGEEILIKSGDGYYLAEYLDKEWQFKLKAGGFVGIKDVFWSYIDAPPTEE
jgi:hypothetical protein